MKYILDFDRTLFDTNALLQKLQAAAVDLTHLGPEHLSGMNMADFLYADTVLFLQSKQPKDIAILTALGASYGDKIREFQTAKVEQEPIISLVDQVVYVEHEKGGRAAEIVRQWPVGEPVVFVDDLLENCLSVQAAVPSVHCFLLRRENAVTQDVFAVSGVTLVQNLSEVEAFVAAL